MNTSKQHTSILYHTDNTIFRICNIDDHGQFHGIYKMYKENGHLWKEQLYRHGKLQGETK